MAPNSWNEWSKYVLKTLEDMDIRLKEIDNKMNDIHIDIAKLKVKSGIWGAIGGIIPILISILIYFIFVAIKT